MASLLRLMLLALALVSASGLRVFVGTSRPGAARVAVTMALPSIEDARSLSTEEIEAEMVTAQKELFELRKKVKTRQQVIALASPAIRANKHASLRKRPPRLLLVTHTIRSSARVWSILQVKPHLFTHTKHRIAQLQTLLSQRAA